VWAPWAGEPFLLRPRRHNSRGQHPHGRPEFSSRPTVSHGGGPGPLSAVAATGAHDRGTLARGGPRGGEKRWLDGQCGGPYKTCQPAKAGAAVTTHIPTSPHTPPSPRFFSTTPHAPPHPLCTHPLLQVCVSHTLSLLIERAPPISVTGAVTVLVRTLVGTSWSELAVVRVASQQGHTSRRIRTFSAGVEAVVVVDDLVFCFERCTLGSFLPCTALALVWALARSVYVSSSSCF